jgi:hypothetical protein
MRIPVAPGFAKRSSCALARSASVAVLLCALGSTAASASPRDVWGKLERPLHLPRLAAGARCPVSTVDPTAQFGAFGTARGIGDGPAYPIGFSRPGSVLGIAPPASGSEFANSAWGGQKVLWLVTPAYRGPVLIRGRRLDGTQLVRFDGAGVRMPPKQLRIPTSATLTGNPGVRAAGQRYRPSYTRLLVPGCYAYQVDGTTFSRTIVFRARR